MKLGVMQPYFIPYLGYWQLMNAVDAYVVYDDVNYINRGWVNRNNILCNGQRHLVTLPLMGASQNKKINEIMISNNEREVMKMLKTIQFNYQKAPCYQDVWPMVEEIVLNPEKNLARFLYDSIVRISSFLEMDTKIVLSSEIEKDNSLCGEEKIIHLCKTMGASTYINAIGGAELYSREHFKAESIDLRFLKTQDVSYQQFGKEFVPYLSIIDVMMFNTPKTVVEMLGRYDYVPTL